jgi:hypothetical protein
MTRIVEKKDYDVSAKVVGGDVIDQWPWPGVGVGLVFEIPVSLLRIPRSGKWLTAIRESTRPACPACRSMT